MRLLLDVCVGRGWIAWLDAHDIAAARWRDLGRMTASDTEILEFARANGYIVFTHDLDFGTILATTGRDSPSVVQVRGSDLSPDAVGAMVLEALRECAELLAGGVLVTVDAKRARATVLPIDVAPGQRPA